jgi:hypothetical protein
MERKKDLSHFERAEIFIIRLALFIIFLLGIGLILFHAFKHFYSVVSAS